MDEVKVCCLCGREFTGWGNNPWPVDKHPDHRCCDDCNAGLVIPARLALISVRNKEEK